MLTDHRYELMTKVPSYLLEKFKRLLNLSLQTRNDQHQYADYTEQNTDSCCVQDLQISYFNFSPTMVSKQTTMQSDATFLYFLLIIKVM